jgi:hypothetical protein
MRGSFFLKLRAWHAVFGGLSDPALCLTHLDFNRAIAV